VSCVCQPSRSPSAHRVNWQEDRQTLPLLAEGRITTAPGVESGRVILATTHYGGKAGYQAAHRVHYTRCCGPAASGDGTPKERGEGQDTDVYTAPADKIAGERASEQAPAVPRRSTPLRAARRVYGAWTAAHRRYPRRAHPRHSRLHYTAMHGPAVSSA
jgi:hypothetical protein